MALCRFYQPVPRGRGLPDPVGPLSLTVLSPAIEQANAEVAQEAVQGAEPRLRRWLLPQALDSLRAKIGVDGRYKEYLKTK